jgi:predicted enzyme related to lactoylglutathione lyase
VWIVIDAAADRYEAAQRFWSGATGWAVSDAWDGHPEFRTLEPGDGDNYALVQRVDDDAPTAVHFDLTTDDLNADLDRLTKLGATSVAAFESWHVLRSPGGMEFCLVHSSGTNVPAAATWDAGHRSRLVQLCIDSPPALHDQEVSFWRAATGWRFEPGESDEFAGKLWPPANAPIHFLLQRLGDDAATATRVHIDLGTDDLEAEAHRLEQLGAVRGQPGGGWIQMTDPTGMVFCVTLNSPD